MTIDREPGAAVANTENGGNMGAPPPPLEESAHTPNRRLGEVLVPLAVFAIVVSIPQLSGLFPYSEVAIGFVAALLATVVARAFQRDRGVTVAGSPANPAGSAAGSPSDWPQRQFHNEKIYWNLEQFIKVTLGIAGGLAFLSVNIPDDRIAFVNLMVRAAGVIELFAGVVLTFNIWCHHRFKHTRMNTPEYNRTLRAWQQADVWIMFAIITMSLGAFAFTWFIAHNYLVNP
ncbi:MAG: hypothetical protein KJO82_04195 [Gammaproteobacteria bacterium]|nr:hypothetical protein [Gammaproteobacteria bacterium]